MNGAGIDAGGNISLSSAANTDLNMRSLSDRYSEFFPDSRIPELRSHLKAGGNLLISSAADIGLQGAEVVAGKTATLQAGKLIWLGAYGYGVTDRQNDNNRDELQVTSLLRGVKGLTLAANSDIRSGGSLMSSDGNITLTSGGNILLEAVQSHSYREGGNDYSERHLWKGTEISAGGMLTIISTGNILFQATRLVVKGLGADWKPAVISGDWVAKLAKAESDLLSWQNTVTQRTNDKNNKEGVVNSKNNYLNQLNGELQAIELEISRIPKNSRGPRLNVLALQKKEKSDEISRVVTELNSLRVDLESTRQQLSVAESERNNASKTLDTARQNAREKGLSEEKLRAEVDAHNQAEAMRSGSMDIAAKDSYLYAQAAEESSLYEKKETKRKWWGHKTEITRTRHDITNKVTEFLAAGNISLLSLDDSTYEASRIEAGKNALLTSLHGRVNFRAVKNSTFEQTVSTSKGFFIKQSNKGYSEGKWVLPSVHAGGISADVKAKNGQALQGAVTALSALPGSEWLKGLNTRSDVQWNTVKDAYDSWDYKSQSLNPAVAAVIAIAAAAVTAGSSLVASAATSVASTVGGGAVATGAVTAGMSSLAAQAAVALVENQGNLSKTLKSLGSSNSVKSLATSMAIGGALAGFDEVMNVSVSPDKARLPALAKDEEWSKVVQRVAGQSVISSSLNTGINGGSFKDNLVNALLSNIGNQVQAEGAGLIGDNGEVLDVAGKSVSHAVLAGISAEIGRGDGKGAAAGALAAELAGVIMQSSLFEPANLNEQERQLRRLQEALSGNEAKEQTARVIGALTGALTTHTPEGAYSGADSAQNVYRYNMTEHMLQQYALDNQRDILAADKGDKEAAKRVQARREAAIIVAAASGGGMALTAGGMTLVSAAPELVLAARLVIAGCKTNPALCLNQAGIYTADIVAPEAIIGTGAVTTGSTLILGKTEDSLKKLSQQLVKTYDELNITKTLNIQPVAGFIKGETAAGAGLSTKTAAYVRDIQKINTDQLVKVFDPNQSSDKLNVFGKEFAQVLGDGGSNKYGTTKVFATEKLSERDILNYAKSLAGPVPLQEQKTPLGIVYYAKKDGMTINLRNFSRSKDDTKARWTVEVIKNEQLNNLQGKVKKPIEIKFR
ncbi:DUF637 domain-containing protein [Klebsiella variicola]|uniref:DUF637 domain-containing protein n=1 Tax=Klebsiella variicola TaxID=244366 RepID=UPI0031018E53